MLSPALVRECLRRACCGLPADSINEACAPRTRVESERLRQSTFTGTNRIQPTTQIELRPGLLDTMAMSAPAARRFRPQVTPTVMRNPNSSRVAGVHALTDGLPIPTTPQRNPIKPLPTRRPRSVTGSSPSPRTRRDCEREGPPFPCRWGNARHDPPLCTQVCRRAE